MIVKVAVGLFAAALVAGCVSEQTYKAEVAKSNTYQELSQRLRDHGAEPMSAVERAGASTR